MLAKTSNQNLVETLTPFKIQTTSTATFWEPSNTPPENLTQLRDTFQRSLRSNGQTTLHSIIVMKTTKSNKQIREDDQVRWKSVKVIKDWLNSSPNRVVLALTWPCLYGISHLILGCWDRSFLELMLRADLPDFSTNQKDKSVPTSENYPSEEDILKLLRKPIGNDTVNVVPFIYLSLF